MNTCQLSAGAQHHLLVRDPHLLTAVGVERGQPRGLGIWQIKADDPESGCWWTDKAIIEEGKQIPWNGGYRAQRDEWLEGGECGLWARQRGD